MSFTFDDLSDAELLVASVSDPDAFAALYSRWARPLLAYFAQRVHDADVAGDLTAETLAVVFEKRHRFRDTGDPATAWLYTIAGRQLSSYWRRQAVERKAVQRLGLVVPAMDDVSETAIEALLDAGSQPVLDALRAISAAEREAVELRVLEELSYREIASRLNCSVIAARVRVHRGLGRLSKTTELAHGRL
jgi:RNA polymerase sigma-70 factor (ECF subfamily)